MSKIRDEMAEKRAERCWQGNEVRKLETRCDFIEGWQAALKNAPEVKALVEENEELKRLVRAYTS